MRLRLLFALLLPLVSGLQAPAQEHIVTKDILVICTHAESSEWSQDMLRPIHELEAERSELQVYSSVLRMTTLADEEDLARRLAEIFDPFGEEGPVLTILVGCAGFMLADDIQERWPGAPVILAGENDYYCDTGYTIRGRAEHDAARHPVSDLIRTDRANLTLVQTPSMIGETVELMLTLIPGMQKLIFIAGENFQCREQQVRLEEYLAEHHPALPYEPIYSYEHSTEELIGLLEQEDPARTGVLFGSWLTHKGYQEAISSRQNVGHIIEAAIPVFDIFRSDFEANRNLIGFYTYDHNAYHQTMKSRIVDVLDEHIAPRGMPFVRFNQGHPVVNWASMKLFGLDTSLVPPDATVYGRPVPFFRKHRDAILWSGAGFLLLSLLMGVILTRRNMNRQREEKEAAERSSRMKTMFIQNMSHEIRTPLNAIVGFSQLLSLPDGVNTEAEKEEYSSYVQNNSQMLMMLVGDILNLSDVESGRYSISPAPTDLNEVCRMAIKTVETRVQPGVALSYEPGLPDDLRVVTDGGRVQQVLINYLTNACKHTFEGSITVASSLTEHPGEVTLSVTDTGTGVPAEQAEEIFKRFVMLNPSIQGTGLGLHICRLIASRLGGQAFLDTTHPGPGARFILTLPSRES